MLDRILKRSARDGSGDPAHGARHDRVGRHAGLSHIADAIRDDIAFARVDFTAATVPGQPAVHDPIRDAPPGITYLVETPHDAGVVITIDDVPRDWGWVSEDGIETVSPALRALADELADIMDGYNRGDADVGHRFFGSVRVNGETLVWGSPGS
ncbi:hypothetical protein SAMN05444583_11090 [Rhodococcus maanshanensis]|uniref:Uncharacterized protein n=2 Tax=Rhodococcus maanshanensis TaxID=183556 RepID=A0A1H7QZ72_9NOCA|nr:hypothetical protein SAMN05444583_11090 [Rhodococcus maanshanensis]